MFEFVELIKLEIIFYEKICSMLRVVIRFVSIAFISDIIWKFWMIPWNK